MLTFVYIFTKSFSTLFRLFIQRYDLERTPRAFSLLAFSNINIQCISVSPTKEKPQHMNIWEIATNYYQYFLRGTRTTILISLLTVFCGSILGCLIAFMRLSKFKPLEKFASIYITVIRGTPMLVQLYIVYYQLDFISYPTGTLFDVDLERALPCIIALSINSSAYVAEIIRAGIQAVDKGQMEGARSCGMTNAQAMRYVVMPQAVKNILPAIGNEFVTMVKETSIIQYLGIGDLMYNNGIVVTATYNPLPCYYISAIIYLALNIILGKGLNIFEGRLKKSER